MPPVTDGAPSRIPAPLDDLGEVFVPIEPREKGTTRPRTDEHLYAPDDPILGAYIEAGHNYGVACKGDFAVLDADEPDVLQEARDVLPETASQVSGSRTSEHDFLFVPGLEKDIPLYHPKTDENVGHIKAAPQSYVVGPGSSHPSGGRYGPLQGETIATVEEADLRGALEPFLRESTRELPHESDIDAPSGVTRQSTATGDDVDLSVFDVVSAGRYPEGARREHPFHGSDTGANFMVDEHGETFRCWRHDCTGNALHLVGIEQGIIDCGEWLPTGLDSDTWSEIFAAAREAGYDLPEFDPEDSEEPVAVLPDLTPTWDWQNAGEAPAEPTLTIEAARERTKARIADAYTYGDRVLVEALPTMGKSYGSVAAVRETDVPVTLLTTRGRKEQYEQLEEWCREHGLTYKTLPSFTHDCDTANGEHGEEWRERVMGWYRRGATPQDIHMYAEEVLGRPLPCQQYEGHDCPLAALWNFDPEEHPDTEEPWDVLIGHYSHAHKPKVTQGRAVVFDEFPGDTYETRLGTRLPGAVTAYLQAAEELPFEDYTDLIEHRDDEQRRADALAWFQDQTLERDARRVFDDEAAHAAAPLAVFTLLAGVGDDLGNGWERADLGEHGVGLHDRGQGAVYVLSPPPLEYTRAIVALDGTPTPSLWERTLGVSLNHRPVLTEGERAEYIRDVLGLDFIRTTEAVKPYNSADHVSTDRDAAVLEKIGERHDTRPAVVTTATAELAYEETELADLVDETQHYGNVLGSNQFAETRVGAVVGSNHYGDHYIEKWGAYDGETVVRGDGKGTDLSYGDYGDRVLKHMREHETLQAAMRFGRDGNGATVYVHTNTLPDWVPVAGEGRIVSTWSDGMREVLEAAESLEEWTTAELAAQVSISERQVREHLHRLVDRGVLDVEVEGRGYVWRDDGLHRVSEHGEVELAPVDIDDLSAENVAEVARSSTYTWDFRNTAADKRAPPENGESGHRSVAGATSSGGDRPPDDPV